MIDNIEIVPHGGKGGDGSVSFRRAKFVPFGGPDGGNGGRGGNVVVIADPSTTDLRRFNPKGQYCADDGRHGEGNDRQGKNGKDLVLRVPPGTIVKATGDGGEPVVTDLEEAGHEVVLARGGKGGWGNAHFTTSTNQAPKIAQRGALGEKSHVTLEMRLIADVGIIGYPNAGKSTLLAAASAARPKIASYPFTTLEPVLGVVEVGKGSFTLAEIPGLIEGAHVGKGLGHDFLRHAMRTRLFIHLVDASASSPIENMASVNTEISLYDPALAARPQVVALNKIDLPEAAKRIPELQQALRGMGIESSLVSAVTLDGVPELMGRVGEKLAELAKPSVEAPPKVFRPRPREAISVSRDGDTFILNAPDLQRIFTVGGVTGSEVRWQLRRMFARMGVDRALRQAGAKSGDKVRCGNLEWEW